MPQVAVIIQARMGSERLPGKVLRTVLGRPLLAYQLARIAQAERPTRLMVATPDGPADEPIAALCTELRVPVVRGSEGDLLGRYLTAMDALGLAPEDRVVRVTADCPLLDPEVQDAVVDYQQSAGLDYAGTSAHWPRGLDAEVFPVWALRQAGAEAHQPFEREHVTPFLYRNPDRFRCGQLPPPGDLADRPLSSERWTVDTPEDFALVSQVLEALIPTQPRFRMRDVLALLDAHPEWRSLNAHIQQKTLLGLCLPPLAEA